MVRSGKQLLLDGQPYRFTGLNIYNANSIDNCWYTLGEGSGLDDALTAIGPGKRAFRAWFFQSLATTDGTRDWSAFDHTLAVAAAHGVRVIPTLTNQWGDCEVGGYKDETWFENRYYAEPDPGGTVSYRDFVADVVSRYKDDPTILAWQLINEAEVKPSLDSVTCTDNAKDILKSFAIDVSGLIKSIDPNHLVSLGTIGSGQCGAQWVEYQDLHDIATIDLCEYHDYDPNAPMPGDQFNGLEFRIEQCNALDKPLFIGEAGIKPIDVVGEGAGTLQGRADAFGAKLDAQFSAGVVGYLAWAWSNLGSTIDNFDIGPGDPTLEAITFPKYVYAGFFHPIDNGIRNKAKGGQAIPVKWRLTDLIGAPVADPSSFSSLGWVPVDCADLSPTGDAIEEVGNGGSQLTYLGDGNWQINWKTLSAWKGQCRRVVLGLADHSEYTADFQFK